MSVSGSPLSENTSLVGSSVDSPDRRKGVLPVCGNRSGQGSYTRLCSSPTLTPWDRLRASNDDPREGPEPSNAKGLRPWFLRSRLAGLDDLDLNLDRHIFFDGYHLPPIVQRGHQTTPKLNTPLVLASPRLVIVIPKRTANTPDFPRISLLGISVNRPSSEAPVFASWHVYYTRVERPEPRRTPAQ